MSDSEVYVGSKSLGSYVSAVNHQLGENGECSVVSRGKENNGTAIDAICIAKRKNENVEITDAEFYTDGFYEDDDGEQIEIPDDESFEDYEEEGYEVTKVSGIRVTLEEK